MNCSGVLGTVTIPCGCGAAKICAKTKVIAASLGMAPFFYNRRWITYLRSYRLDFFRTITIGQATDTINLYTRLHSNPLYEWPGTLSDSVTNSTLEDNAKFLINALNFNDMPIEPTDLNPTIYVWPFFDADGNYAGFSYTGPQAFPELAFTGACDYWGGYFYVHCGSSHHGRYNDGNGSMISISKAQAFVKGSWCLVTETFVNSEKTEFVCTDEIDEEFPEKIHVIDIPIPWLPDAVSDEWGEDFVGSGTDERRIPVPPKTYRHTCIWESCSCSAYLP